MKYKNQNIKKLITLIVILGAGIFINQATAQDDKNGESAVRFLGEQFLKQDIPVVAINILQEDPLQLEFVIQSTSGGEKGTPEDPINFHMVRREATLAQRQGYNITRITQTFLNKYGVQISKSDVSIKSREIVLFDLPPAKIDDISLKGIALNKLDTLGISVGNLSISSMDGFQTLHATQIVSSMDDANKVDLGIVGDLRLLLDDLNKQGAQIVMTRVEIKNESGDYYFNYLYDLQTRSEVWWMADGFNDNWFPHPGPDPAPIQFPIETFMPLPAPTELLTETPSPLVTFTELPTETPTEVLTPTETPAP